MGLSYHNPSTIEGHQNLPYPKYKRLQTPGIAGVFALTANYVNLDVLDELAVWAVQLDGGCLDG